MPQHEYIPVEYEVADVDGTEPYKLPIRLQSTSQGQSFEFTFDAIRPHLFRTTFTSAHHPLPPHPSARPPAVDLEGIEPVVRRRGNVIRIILHDIEAII